MTNRGGLTAFVPRERLMLCHAWAMPNDHAIQSGTDWYEVLAIEIDARGDATWRTPLILFGGQVVNVEDARRCHWPESSLYEVYLTTWPRDCDERHLSEYGARLEEEAVRREEVRQKECPPDFPEAREGPEGATGGQSA